MGRVSTCQKYCKTIDLRGAQVNYCIWRAPHRHTSERPRDFKKDLCINFEFWNDWVESVSTTPVGWIPNYDRRQTKSQRNVFFTSDEWSLISLKEGFEHSEGSGDEKYFVSKDSLAGGRFAPSGGWVVWPSSWCLAWPDPIYWISRNGPVWYLGLWCNLSFMSWYPILICYRSQWHKHRFPAKVT